MRPIVLLGVMFSSLILSGCVTTGGSSVKDERQSILTMKNETLQTLYKLKPDVKSQIASAPGYAVFSNVNVNLLLASVGGGKGVVQSKSGKRTYMKMGEVGLGLGLGVKDFRVVFVFHTQDVMNRFVESGWAFGGQADAAAKAGDKGAAISGEMTVDNMTIYPITENGLALQATVKGTKYWKDDSLN